MDENGWKREQFVGIRETLWTFPSGPDLQKFDHCSHVGEIFDVLWQGVSEHIVEIINNREKINISTIDLNLFLCSMLVMGLTPSPSIDLYWKEDKRGIFGSKWLQSRFSRDRWHRFNSQFHFDPMDLCNILKKNFQESYLPGQVICVDEIIIPFQGRWKWIQHVKGKPHNTGMIILKVSLMNGLKESKFLQWQIVVTL